METNLQFSHFNVRHITECHTFNDLDVHATFLTPRRHFLLTINFFTYFAIVSVHCGTPPPPPVDKCVCLGGGEGRKKRCFSTNKIRGTNSKGFVAFLCVRQQQDSHQSAEGRNFDTNIFFTDSRVAKSTVGLSVLLPDQWGLISALKKKRKKVHVGFRDTDSLSLVL